MSKSLVIVESPTKVKTLHKYFGKNYLIKASVGHVIDLPKSKLGIDIGDRFEPKYEVIKGKEKTLDEIKEASEKVEQVYLAPDPDREGEAIAWHLANEITSHNKKKRKKTPKIYRILIDEITKKGVEKAMAEPGELNLAKFESQQARRMLDRLVGYKISPLLWDKVRRGLSAGRVQSVALRIVSEREREIQKFIPQEYWSVEVLASADQPPKILLRLIEKDSQKLDIPNQNAVEDIEKDLKSQKLIVQKIQTKERKRTPPAAFTTSKLQQEASRKLGFGAKKTMMLAQQLYEGVELGEEGQVGLITYMRTDSTRLSNEAVEGARQYIKDNYPEFLPKEARLYKVSKKAQDAHEAIRPTLMIFPPEKVKKFLKKDQFNLYKLIWDRFIACQMEDARYDQTSIDVAAGKYLLRATGSVLKYEGFMKLYVEGTDQGDLDSQDDKPAQFPPLTVGQALTMDEIKPQQHFTKPPPRFTEASLVKELEERGIGRPSTYASILSTLQDRKYVEKMAGGPFHPTELGFIINDMLVENFKDIVDVEFTAQMESKLDQVEEGEADWQKVLKNFYGPFEKDLKVANKKMRDLKKEEIPTDIVCEKCSKMMIIKWGRNGHFLACSGYPECKNTKEFRKTPEGKIEILPEEKSDETCEKCGSPMLIKHGRYGKFLACSNYPDCKTTQSMSTGVLCPEKDCTGKLLEKRSRFGRPFYGCSRYPNCTHASWNRPTKEACPECGAPYLVEKFTKRNGFELKCPKKECGYSKSVEQPEGTQVAS